MGLLVSFIDWVGQKVHSGFLYHLMGKKKMNFFVIPIFSCFKLWPFIFHLKKTLYHALRRFISDELLLLVWETLYPLILNNKLAG